MKGKAEEEEKEARIKGAINSSLSHRLISIGKYVSYLLDKLLLAAGARLYALGDRAVDVVVRDPALVVRLAGGLGAGEGIGGVDGLLGGLLGGARLLGLGEQGLDPGLVDKEEGASEGGSEDQVEEDAVNLLAI